MLRTSVSKSSVISYSSSSEYPTLTLLLTPLSAQHAETVDNREQQFGLDKPILQPSATPRNRGLRIVAPKCGFEYPRPPSTYRVGTANTRPRREELGGPFRPLGNGAAAVGSQG